MRKKTSAAPYHPIGWNLGIGYERGAGVALNGKGADRKSTRLNSSHGDESRMPSSA